MSGQLPSSEARRRFRNSLLPYTVVHAEKESRFYSRKYNGAASSIREIEDLPLLPILTKQEVIQNIDDLICGSDFPGLIQHTTGTTGVPLPIYRSVHEIEFIRSFFNQVVSGNHLEPVPIVLQLTDLYHGPALPIPSRCHAVSVGLTDDTLLTEAVRLLTHRHKLPGIEERVSVIVGLVPYIKTLTSFLIESGFDFSTSRVKTICPLCTIITPRWRRLLTSIWKANVVDRYSLSEIFGGATYCLACDSYHFDPPVIAEVVDPFSKEPSTSGVGILVLTSLYPFVQKQPMIRYYTDDLVEINVDACQPDLSVRFKGRFTNACCAELNGKEKIIISPVDIYEILDEMPDIAFSERFIDIHKIRDHSAAGSLKFTIEKECFSQRTEIKVLIELRYNPYLYRERIGYLRQHVTSQLMLRCPYLKDGIITNQIGFHIEFFPPNSLPSFALKV